MSSTAVVPASAGSGWTESRIDRLKALLAQGLSASRIALTLGGVTRNAVVGKIHRLGLAGRRPPSPPGRRSAPPPGAARRRRLPSPAPRPYCALHQDRACRPAPVCAPRLGRDYSARRRA